MRRLVAGLIVYICMCCVASASNDKGVFVDIQDSLDSWMNSSIKGGDLKKLPDAITDGDLYYRAQQLAELQIARPAHEAVQITHDIISGFCGNTLDMKHTVNVFSESKYALELDDLMRSRTLTDEIRKFPFDTSCTEVFKCYYRDQLLQAGENLDEYDAYSNTIHISCKDVVERIYNRSLMQTNTLEIMESANYGDEIFVNGTLDDSPYDLLETIEEIGDILFAHNADASVIKFYNFRPDINNKIITGRKDPGETIQHIQRENVEENYNQQRDDNIPDGETGSYTPPNQEPSGWIRLHDDTAGGGNSGGSIQNSDECIEDVPEEPPIPPQGELAEELQDFVHDRNRQIVFDNIIAAKLGAMLDPKLQEGFGDDNIVMSDEAGMSAMAELSVQDVLGYADDDLTIQKPGEPPKEASAFEKHIKECIDKFTEEGEAGWKKIVGKSITQPSEFTSCIFKRLCKEVGDTSERGMYRVRVCNVPSSRAYGTTSKQQVKSIEEIVDEIANRCYGLRESGQLLKHNKTKDHWSHKLESLKLGEIFSFGVSVTFKPLPKTIEPSAEKRDQVENNTYLTKLMLGFNETLTHEDERNKYIVLAKPVEAKFMRQEASKEIAGKKAQILKASVDKSYPRQQREKTSQSAHYVKIHSELIDFIDQNTEMRMFANEHVDSMKVTRMEWAKRFGAK